MTKEVKNIRALKIELKDIAEHIHWYLSDWMDEASIQKPIKKLLAHDLTDTWVNLKKVAKTQLAFEDFFCMATDSCYRYTQITEKTKKQQRDELLDIKRYLKKLKAALNVDSTVRDWGIDGRLNDFVLAEVEKLYFVRIKKQSPDDNRIKNQFFLRTTSILDELVMEVDVMLLAPPDTRLSKKRGRAGMIAFYTNSLCEITKRDFERVCYHQF